MRWTDFCSYTGVYLHEEDPPHKQSSNINASSRVLESRKKLHNDSCILTVPPGKFYSNFLCLDWRQDGGGEEGEEGPEERQGRVQGEQVGHVQVQRREEEESAGEDGGAAHQTTSESHRQGSFTVKL